VSLRAWTPNDLPDRVMGFADASVQRFSWAGTTPYTEADAYDFFAYQRDARESGESLSLAFTRPGDPDSVLGGGSVHDIDLTHGRAGVGYWLTPAARGQGVATHATLLMARWAFSTLSIARLELTCGPDNGPSQRVAERCGFTREGVLRSHIPFKGGRRDTVIFSLLAGELDRGAASA
jgi:RimJ/RimL family protein N-acetyltransferase